MQKILYFFLKAQQCVFMDYQELFLVFIQVQQFYGVLVAVLMFLTNKLELLEFLDGGFLEKIDELIQLIPWMMLLQFDQNQKMVQTLDIPFTFVQKVSVKYRQHVLVNL
eukprot:TRINITY_DN4156_c0_g4_i1.p8 TRINITY_DN4156_c0_g4~~TRINITY_DN4156_c0_g4_i1.p8  ORF type:complete len:109 (+),score=5.83 TRINITY_DN4156_c0_g4_i1:313-639(+)